MLKSSKVPIPADAHAYCNGKVMHLDKMRGGGKNPRKTLIGRLVSNEVSKDGRPLMYPNDNYFLMYKEEYVQELSQEAPGRIPTFPPETICVGLFALVLGVAVKLGLYQLLIQVYNVKVANAILDLAMYFMLENSNALNMMESRMNNQLMFSIKSHPDSYYSKLFGSNGESTSLCDANNHEFICKWVEMQKRNGIEDVIISLDGTNMDCKSKTNSQARLGKAKSKNNVNIVGSMVAVVADGEHKGMPLVYFITPGNKPDMVTAKTVLTFLKEYKLRVKAVVADRGFCDEDIMAICDELDIPFLIMMKSDYSGFQTMYKKYSEEVIWNFDYWLREKGLKFGITEADVTVFGKESKNPRRKGCIGIFFDGERWVRSSKKFCDKMQEEMNNIELKLGDLLSHNNCKIESREDALKVLQGEETCISVSDKFKEYMSVDYDSEDKSYIFQLNTNKIKQEIMSYGWACMVSSKDQSAQEMSNSYKVRETSEDDFSCYKSQLGFEVLGVSGDERYHSKSFCGFIALIIRTEIKNIFSAYEAKHKKQIDTNDMIQQMSNICFTRSKSVYVYSGQISTIQRDILKSLGIDKNAIEMFSQLVNARDSETEVEALRAKERVILTEPAVRKHGRPKGSPNKKTLAAKAVIKINVATQTTQASSNQVNAPDASTSELSSNIGDLGEPDPNVKHRRGGRKKGSKNKKTLQREAEEAAERDRRIKEGLPPEDPKPKRGRKKGSKNKKTLQREAEEAAERERRLAAGLPAEDTIPHKQRGRPKGSKNKSTLLREAKQEVHQDNCESGLAAEHSTSRLGGKYKATLMQESYDMMLAEKTGIDIIGTPPPRPWSSSVRYHENKRRAQLRKQAEEILYKKRSHED